MNPMNRDADRFYGTARPLPHTQLFSSSDDLVEPLTTASYQGAHGGPFARRFARKGPVFPAGVPTPFEPGRRLWPGAFPPVQAAASPVPHRRALTCRLPSRLRAAPPRLGKLTRTIPVFQPATSHF